MDKVSEVAFQIILYSGNGKTNAMEAIQEAKKGNYDEAQHLIEKADEELAKAHSFQTGLLQKEASGTETSLNIILIHSQDHLMTSMTVRDLAIEFIEMYNHVMQKNHNVL